MRGEQAPDNLTVNKRKLEILFFLDNTVVMIYIHIHASAPERATLDRG
jgi:hypothetical protein